MKKGSLALLVAGVVAGLVLLSRRQPEVADSEWTPVSPS